MGGCQGKSKKKKPSSGQSDSSGDLSSREMRDAAQYSKDVNYADARNSPTSAVSRLPSLPDVHKKKFRGRKAVRNTESGTLPSITISHSMNAPDVPYGSSYMRQKMAAQQQQREQKQEQKGNELIDGMNHRTQKLCEFADGAVEMKRAAHNFLRLSQQVRAESENLKTDKKKGKKERNKSKRS